MLSKALTRGRFFNKSTLNAARAFSSNDQLAQVENADLEHAR